MSNITSEYTISLNIENDDKTRDAVKKLRQEIGKISPTMSMEDINRQIESAMKLYDEFAKDASIANENITSAFTKEADNAIKKLIAQYGELDKMRYEKEAQKKQLEDQKKQLEISKARANTLEAVGVLETEISDIEEKISQLSLDEIENQIKNNRELRKKLRLGQQYAQSDKIRNKIEELQHKKGLVWFSKERKANNDQIKLLQEKLKLLNEEERKQSRIALVLKNSGATVKEIYHKTKSLSKAAYTSAGLIGGAARTVTGGAKAAASLLGGGLNAATQAADREVDKERQANRIKGFNKDDAKEILGELYIRTGSNDYGSIVDAINKVQGTLGKLSKEDLISAAEMEMRYPGMSLAFASSSHGADMASYNEYAAQLNAIQSATGASDEQIATSIRKFSNRKDIDASGGAISDYQAVYLALQNSGAFETEEEAEQAFNVFLKKQKASKQSVMEYAQSHDWTAGIHNDRDKLQVKNAMANMDWETFSKKLETAQASPSEGLQKSQSEQMAIQMRKVEEQKNKLLMTLIPAALPLVEAIAKMLEGGGAQLIADGLNDLFTIVVPVLLKVLNMLNDYILSPLLGLIKKLMDWLGEDNPRNDDDIVLPSSTSKNANGGIVWGTSIVGERGPEAIIPLDYSRAQRAENIAYSIQNNFSMSGNETTALSLAQAVSSRDFSRAMGKAAFKAGRLGAF